MANFITTSAFSTSRIQSDYSAQFKRLFASLTGYDIMAEQSRRDLEPANTLNTAGKAGQSNYLLPVYISKFTVLFERK